MSIHADTADIVIYVSAGFATASNFLDDFAAKLASRYEQTGKCVRVYVHFPYGHWDRSKRGQLQEIIRDMWHNAHGKSSIYGGKSLLQFVLSTKEQGKKLLFIGHSAGAIASILAADELERLGYDILGVIQIGSPRSSIPATLKHKVLYIHATNPQNQSRDPISRLGTWGGWGRTRLGIHGWKRAKHAPIHQRMLPIIGSHADYFRDHNPYIWQNATNLQTTMNAIWTWIQTLEKDVEHD
ncbi:hypothetical protein [Paenibacillus qinlingensis]|uniref:Fungal lipase-like domain-containing protein n=1 Tax=Paenibacillus qinlingensis TaxID=1837343 RepID=A0ABU1NQV7_9BACL|nr:hypothetical protein [Paenibacillus qinlingensis]MDR6549808.1 hypothetical protein [Paenibacillus qinlingensis]